METATKMVSTRDGHALIQMDTGTLKMMVLEMTAHIIHECTLWHPLPDLGESGISDKSDTFVLNHYTNWADHGYINALQAQVGFVAEFQYALMEGWLRGPMFLEEMEVTLIIEALNAYQTWKEDYVRRDKMSEGHGPNWGDSTPFTQAKWNEHNARFKAWWASRGK